MKVLINTEFIKLDQVIKLAGLVQTGGTAKHIISEGMVMVNGVVEKQRGKKIRPEDVIEIKHLDEKGKLIEIYKIEVAFGQED